MNTELPAVRRAQRTGSSVPTTTLSARLDEDKLLLTGSETITYFNNSPDMLTYLWLQLDENEHSSINNADYQDASTLAGRSKHQYH